MTFETSLPLFVFNNEYLQTFYILKFTYQYVSFNAGKWQQQYKKN